MVKFFSKIISRIFERGGFTPHITKLCGGFTLIELLVVLAITSMLSAALLLYNHTTRQQVALYTEEAKFVQVVYRAKSLSLSTYRQPSSSKICGYGVHIDYNAMTYMLFSYAKPPGIQCRDIPSIDRDLEETLSSYALGRNVVFLDSPSSGATRIDDVLFVPPDPSTLINSHGVLIQNGFGNAVFETQDGSARTTITVNSGGQVTF